MSAARISNVTPRTKHRWLRMGTRLAFWPGLWFCRALEWVGLWRHWDRVDDHVIVGAFPSPGDLRRLHALGVRSVLNLCEEHPGYTTQITRLGLRQLHLPAIDFRSPEPDIVAAAVEFLEKEAAAGHVVYLHCKAGRLRSPFIAMAYLIHARGMTVENAARRIRDLRPQADGRLAERYQRQSHSDAFSALEEPGKAAHVGSPSESP